MADVESLGHTENRVFPAIDEITGRVNGVFDRELFGEIVGLNLEVFVRRTLEDVYKLVKDGDIRTLKPELQTKGTASEFYAHLTALERVEDIVGSVDRKAVNDLQQLKRLAILSGIESSNDYYSTHY